MMNAVKEKVWFFDFDGTLSRIVPEPSKAELNPQCRRLLRRLSREPLNRVAILSSRTLDDLAPRVPVPGLFLGGSNGTEWQVPGGHRMTLSGNPAVRLKAIRNRIMGELHDIADIPGVFVEDKKWSVALHTRKSSPAMKLVLSCRLSKWRPASKVRILRGPEVFEVQLVPWINKSFGVRTLCKFLKFRPYPKSLVYAGDDENDALAMRFVSRLGGTAITVGEMPLIPCSLLVKDQDALAAQVCNMVSM